MLAIGGGLLSPCSEKLIRITPRSLGQTANRCGRQIELFSDRAYPFESWEKVTTCDYNLLPSSGSPATPGPTASADRSDKQ